ncbi:MAG: Cof-type family hydrolase [Bacilli bacterium]|nr:Cof-type family hydrolase [Bacilli bacterium]
MDFLWVSNDGAYLDPFTIQEELQPVVWRSILEVLNGADILKIGVKLLEPNPAAYEQLTLLLTAQQSASEEQFRWCFSSDSYIEILAKGVSKWSGILQSQQIRGCRDELIFAIGDHQNDREMIQNVDVGIAMANAIEEVKQVASYVIGHVDDQAVAQFLENLMTDSHSHNDKENNHWIFKGYEPVDTVSFD